MIKAIYMCDRCGRIRIKERTTIKQALRKTIQCQSYREDLSKCSKGTIMGLKLPPGVGGSILRGEDNRPEGGS